jgi:hypothetical protein
LASSTIVKPNIEYAAILATKTSAAPASGLANLAVGTSAAVGMMSAAGKGAMPAGRVVDTGDNTSTVGTKGQASFLQELAAATAPALAALTAANVIERMNGVMVTFPLVCPSC